MSKLLYLSQADVKATNVSMKSLIDTLDTTFKEKAAGNTEMPPKIGVYPGSGDNLIHAMPAYIPSIRSAGIKWVSAFPGNSEKQLPYVNGLIIYNDVDTGLPLAVMDCVWITAIRTGAATALSAKYLARPDSSTVGVLGPGVQGRSNIHALNVLFPLKHVRAYAPRTAASEAFKEDIERDLGLEVVVVNDPRKAVTGCDIVVTAGPIQKTPHATIKAGWFEAGAFASLVDFDSYWSREALHEGDKFCTDDTDQLRYYQTVDYFENIPDIHADLGELASGKKPGRESEDERTIACNLGLAIDDMAVAPLVYQRAVDMGIGTWLPL